MMVFPVLQPPLIPLEIGHECDPCYDNYVNQGFVLDRASTVGLILSCPKYGFLRKDETDLLQTEQFFWQIMP
jgi:hypothetical protein